jgi:flagellar biogenesis protein FliO
MDHLSNVDIYLRFFVALGIIIALIGFAAWFARFLGIYSPLSLRGQRQRRLAVVDSIALDTKRRLILVSRDDVEHLVCIGGTTDFLIEQHVKTTIPAINKDIVEELNKSPQLQQAS